MLSLSAEMLQHVPDKHIEEVPVFYAHKLIIYSLANAFSVTSHFVSFKLIGGSNHHEMITKTQFTYMK